MVTILSNQSLLDVSVQETGSLESVFALAVANDISPTSQLTPGSVLDVKVIYNRNIAEYYKNKNLKPATWYYSELSQSLGIGYMAIESNFIVS